MHFCCNPCQRSATIAAMPKRKNVTPTEKRPKGAGTPMSMYSWNRTLPATDEYRRNFDRIFGKRRKRAG